MYIYLQSQNFVKFIFFYLQGLFSGKKRKLTYVRVLQETVIPQLINNTITVFGRVLEYTWSSMNILYSKIVQSNNNKN